jgi:rhodanese-related sulfurtransferase/rubrerythrin
MGVMDYFKPVSTWTVQKVRDFIDSSKEGEYNLVDVRQPGEYEQGHLPGARLIPVGQLGDRTAELDPGKTTIVYCAAGVRSRAGASILDRAGFREIHSMSGGFNAWQGLVATGFPEAGMAWFAPARSVSELTALAWTLEEGTKTFYATMAEVPGTPEASALFRSLVTAEEHHKELLAALCRNSTGASGDIDFFTLLGTGPPDKVMEGGLRLEEAVAWAVGRPAREIFELSLALEAGSYDRYLYMRDTADDEKSRNVFNTLAVEEKQHLAKLTAAFEKLTGHS